MLQQARPGGRLSNAAAGGALRGPFLAPVELQVSHTVVSCACVRLRTHAESVTQCQIICML